MDTVLVLFPRATDRSYGTHRQSLYFISFSPTPSLQPSLLLTPSKPLTGLLNVLGPHFRNKVVRLLCPSVLTSLVLQPSIGWPVHMQALTLFVFYIIPSTKQKQYAALATKSNSGARLYWKEEMETDQIFEATEEEIVTGSFIQLGQQTSKQWGISQLDMNAWQSPSHTTEYCS